MFSPLFKTEGEYRAAAMDIMRKLMYCLSNKACKPVPAVTQDKIINLEIGKIFLL